MFLFKCASSLVLLAAFAVPLLAADASPFPLAVGPTGRYLVDRAGIPFRLHGDSPWSLIMAVTKEDADVYFADRKAKGVNALILNLVEHKFNGPVDRYGQGPFRTPGDFATPNEAYFAHADWVIRRAAENGMVLLLNPLYLGYRGMDEGWYQEALLNGPFKCHEYGKWVGERYRNYSNIIWVMGGDRRVDLARESIESLARGLREAVPDALFTAHAEPAVSAMEEYAFAGLDLNATYSYDIVHKKLMQDYRRRPVMPYILFESSYEGEHFATGVQIRRQAYWAILSGATGQFYGNRPLWLFDSGWKEALNAPGAKSLVYLDKLFDALPWHELVPDGAHRVVTAGLGEANGMDWLTAAHTRDGRLLVAYLPSKREITVDLAQLAGERFAGWWFDPATGQASTIDPKPSGKQTYTPARDGDWVLVLYDSARAVNPPLH
jgi:hypothetical protein